MSGSHNEKRERQHVQDFIISNYNNLQKQLKHIIYEPLWPTPST